MQQTHKQPEEIIMQSIDKTKYLKAQEDLKKNRIVEENYKTEVKEESRTKHNEFEDKISAIKDKMYESDNHYEAVKEKIEKEFADKRTKLKEDITPIDKIIWLLGRKTGLKFKLDNVKSGRNRDTAELIETYQTQTTTLGLFVGKNDRKVNNYNVSVIGHTSLIDHDSYEFGLKTNQLKGWEINVYGADNYDDSNINDNIAHDIKFFDNKAAAITYAKRGLAKLFPMLSEFNKLDQEFLEVQRKYTIKDFEEIILRKLVHKCSHVSGDNLERAEFGLEHYFPQYGIKISKTELSKLIKAYNEEEEN